MQWRRLAPAVLVILLFLIVIIMKTGDAGGMSQEAFAVLLILFIGIFVFVFISAPDEENIEAIQTSTKTENLQQSGTKQLESVLPDPLDEGFDSPLM